MPFRADPEIEIFRDAEQIRAAVLMFLTNAKSVSVCADSQAHYLGMDIKRIKKEYSDLEGRNVKVRWITEITKDNLSDQRDLMHYAELRHLDGIKATFGVSDKAYIAATITNLNEAEGAPELTYSRTKAIIEQNRNVFDTLWSKAILAEDRIREIEEGVVRSKVRVVKDTKEILQENIQLIRRSNQYSVCSKSDGLLYANNYCLGALKEIIGLHKSGKHAGIRWLTKIEGNEDSRILEAIKKFEDLGMQIRHVMTITPMSIGLSEKEMAVGVESMLDGSLNARALFTSEVAVVEQFAAIFEKLWSTGVEARDKIEEIRNQRATFIDIIQDPSEIQRRYHALVESAKKEVLLFLPTTTAYKREEKIGIFDSLEEAAARGATIRILLPTDKEIEQKIQKMIELRKGFEIHKIKATPATEARSKILVIDRREYLMVELKDNSKETFIEAVGSAIFSNSKPTVLSYVTMFDSLWGQSGLYEKLEAHDRMQKEFINIAAHELRTPTQSILGYAELLQSDPGELAADMLRSLSRNAYRLQGLITDILDVARIEVGGLILEKGDLNLTDLVNTAIVDAENQVSLSRKKIKITHTVKNFRQSSEMSDLVVFADKDRILQVLSNLLGNALKFTKEGEISLTTETVGNEVIINIKDSGTGIDREIFSRLFEKFASKSDKGTGLGLFISKSIIEAHGGRIWAENNPDGKGATFAFTLPMGAGT